MAMYRYRIIPRSGFATPFRSDTLYGHLLWAAAMMDGEANVTSLIDAFANGAPPFILSSAFPSGYLPMPQLPKISRERFNSQFSDNRKLFEMLNCYKAYRKKIHWPVTLWQSNQGKISDEALFIDWIAGEPDCLNQERSTDEQNDMKVAYQPHVSIDRASGSVLSQGGLFFSKGIWYRPGVELDLYVQTESLDTFETLFRHVEAVGYGADKAVGMGQFNFYRDESFDDTLFTVEGSHRLTLSVCFSEELSGYHGYWVPMVKHGRTWSGFGESNPFKKPFFAFAEGSVFKQMPDTGFLLRNIHSDPRIVQIGWPLTIPVTLEDNNAD